MKFRLTALSAIMAALLAACGDNSSSPRGAPPAGQASAAVEADPHGVTAPDAQAATDAPAPEPVDDEGEQLYRNGLRQEAVGYWRNAAAEGDAYANYRLGVEYLNAAVVPRDVDKAAAFQRRAAELGDPRGMFELATLYEYGQGVELSREQAARYYLLAAERGLAEAQNAVAARFERGDGVRRDLVQAYKFYGLARAQGFLMPSGPDDETGSDPMLALEEAMTPEQLAEARRQMAEFAPKNWQPDK